MMKNFETAISFDDVLLVPRHSNIETRAEIDLSSTIGDRDFKIPIVSSPMDTVTEEEMVKAMSAAGGLAVVHRYNTISQQRDIVMNTKRGVAAAAIGVSGDFLERARALFEVGVNTFCVDVAHGHHEMMKHALRSLRSVFKNKINIIAGNVATLEAFNDLADWGADAIRVGIGGGSICSTRIMTGHGIPTFQSVLNCTKSDRSAVLIADGGIKNSGDIVKALAAGADMVMLGSMLAGTEESPGQALQDNLGNKFKVYRGMASREAQIAWRGEARSLEGVSTTVPYKGEVSSILADLTQNIRSGLSYSGCRTISELQAYAKFIRQTSAGQVESHTHILKK
ncbi:MAG: IMP dehydrogenase [Actinomycetota bacterium]|nr:IMP dehydrogenase [Actinomycetota bacterium]